jgi:phenylalanyl-tRNA synthetase beta chain
MNISLNWLTDYVDVSLPAKELAEVFTRIGLNCEGIAETPTDLVLDLEVTSNRSDCLGHLGVARELAAATGQAFRAPELSEPPTAGDVADLASVEVLAPDLCPRYTARVLRGVKVGPSPDWLVERLEATGLRSINNVVDVTNYVLMEYSQPLHSFDYDKLSGGKIIVRRGKPGEVMVSIDETKCLLTESMLVIADAEKAVAIAGIMGGLDTEVTPGTTNVLIEAAQFDPLTTRRTSRALGLMSESNYRFERGVDPVGLERASMRACQMILELAGGELADGIIDVWEEPFRPQSVAMRPERCNALLGLEIPVARQEEILDRLGLSPRVEDGSLICTVPSHRADLRREVDLIEEVGRMEGFDKIPVSGHVSHAVTDEGSDQRLRRKVGQLLTAAGFDEALTYTFEDVREAQLFGRDRSICVDATVRKTNNALRSTLVGSLLRVCKINQDAGTEEVSLFELGAVFPAGEGTLPDEYVELAMVTTRGLEELRGAIEALVAHLDPTATLEVRESDVAGLAQGESAELWLAGESLGTIGNVSEATGDYYDLERGVSAARICLDSLRALSERLSRYKPLPKFPAISRDLSIIVDESATWRQIREAIESVDQPLRTGLDYVMTYRGKQIPKGRKSVTVRLVYRSETGTLRGEDVDEEVRGVVSALGTQLSAELRA